MFLDISPIFLLCDLIVISSHYNDAVLVYVVKIRLKELLYICVVPICVYTCTHVFVVVLVSVYMLSCIWMFCIYVFAWIVCAVFMFNDCILAVFYVLQNIESHVAYFENII